MNRICSTLLSISFLGTAMLAHAQQSPARVSGDVVKVDGAVLEVKSSTGDIQRVKLGDKLRVISISRADLTAITPGAYVAATSLPQPDGTLTAEEIRIFPESMRGAGEGHRLMDNRPGSSMTNATVSNIAAPQAGSTTTTATISNVSAADKTRKITVQYKGGEKQVTITDKVPVFRMEDGDRSELVAGAHVVLNTARQSDGGLISERVTVGKNGTVPPQ